MQRTFSRCVINRRALLRTHAFQKTLEIGWPLFVGFPQHFPCLDRGFPCTRSFSQLQHLERMHKLEPKAGILARVSMGVGWGGGGVPIGVSVHEGLTFSLSFRLNKNEQKAIPTALKVNIK